MDKFVTRPNGVFAPGFYAMLFVVGIGTFFIHEFAHWIAGVAVGHDMVFSPNNASSRDPMSAGDQGLVAAAGPLVTIVQGIAGFWLVRRGRSGLGFALLYMAFYMRLLATGLTLLKPNDEARVSQLSGLGTWTLPLAVVTGLSILFLAASQEMKLKFRGQFFCFVFASVAVTLMVGVDAIWRKA